MKPSVLSTILASANRCPWSILSRTFYEQRSDITVFGRPFKNGYSLCTTMSSNYSTSAATFSKNTSPNFNATVNVKSKSNEGTTDPGAGGDHLQRTADQHREAEIVPMKISNVTDISPTVKQLVLSTEVRPVPISFKAGQWVDMFIPGIETVGGFSICSSPIHLQKTGELSLSVKKSDHPPSKWVHTHSQCKEGNELSVRIGGEFFLDTNDPTNAGKSILLIAGGVGINPLASIIAQIRDYRKHIGLYSSRTLLMFSAKSQKELLFQSRFTTVSLEDPTFSAKYFVTGDSDPDITFTEDIKRGRITKSDIVRNLASHLHLCVGFEDLNSNVIAYICGPPPMIQDTEDILKSIGITNIRYEKWW